MYKTIINRNLQELEAMKTCRGTFRLSNNTRSHNANLSIQATAPKNDLKSNLL